MRNITPLDAPAEFCTSIDPALDALEHAMAGFQTAQHEAFTLDSQLGPALLSVDPLTWAQRIESTGGDLRVVTAKRLEYIQKAVVFMSKYLPYESSFLKLSEARKRLVDAICDGFSSLDERQPGAANATRGDSLLLQSRLIRAARLVQQRDWWHENQPARQAAFEAAAYAHLETFRAFFAGLDDALSYRLYKGVDLPELMGLCTKQVLPLPLSGADAERYPMGASLEVLLNNCIHASRLAARMVNSRTAPDDLLQARNLLRLLHRHDGGGALLRDLHSMISWRTNELEFRLALQVCADRLAEATKALLGGMKAASEETARQIELLQERNIFCSGYSPFVLMNNCLAANLLLSEVTKQLQALQERICAHNSPVGPAAVQHEYDELRKDYAHMIDQRKQIAQAQDSAQ